MRFPARVAWRAWWCANATPWVTAGYIPGGVGGFRPSSRPSRIRPAFHRGNPAAPARSPPGCSLRRGRTAWGSPRGARPTAAGGFPTRCATAPHHVRTGAPAGLCPACVRQAQRTLVDIKQQPMAFRHLRADAATGRQMQIELRLGIRTLRRPLLDAVDLQRAGDDFWTPPGSVSCGISAGAKSR